jgi:phage terminase Nu1 subunit (DNA packaging protein)
MANQRKQKPDDAAPADGISLYEAQRRRTLAQAKQEEIKAQQLAGELVDRETIKTEWLKTAAAIRNRLLAIPTKTAPLVLAVKTLPEVKAILEQQIYEALHELSVTRLAGDGPDAASDRQPVGRSAPQAQSRK